MSNYILSEAAKEDLKRIYRFGYEQFGEKQAERYFTGLINCFERIAQSPLSFPLVPELKSGYRRSVFLSDSIYYKLSDGRVEIMAIIGSQDVAKRF